MHSGAAAHLTNASLTMIAQKQQLATMENVKTHVRSLDPVELMPFAPQLIIAQCAPVHREQMATHKSAAYLLSVSATPTAIVKGPVSGTSVLMCAAYPMSVDRTPTAEPPTILQDASVCQDSLESQPSAVPNYNCVQWKSNVHPECCAALESVHRHVNHRETVWTTSCVTGALVSASVKTRHNARHFIAVKMDYVFKNPGAQMMLTATRLILVLEEKMDFLNVKMHALVLSFVVAMLSVPHWVTRLFALAQMDSSGTQTMRKLGVRRSSVL